LRNAKLSPLERAGEAGSFLVRLARFARFALAGALRARATRCAFRSLVCEPAAPARPRMSGAAAETATSRGLTRNLGQPAKRFTWEVEAGKWKTLEQ
jgi:hypothetical protein